MKSIAKKPTIWTKDLLPGTMFTWVKSLHTVISCTLFKRPTVDYMDSALTTISNGRKLIETFFVSPDYIVHVH